MNGAMEGIVVKDVAKAFDGRQVLGPLNLTVDKNKVVCVIGPSGAGKTTLLRVIAGLEKPDAGGVALGGSAGMVFQQGFLWPHKTAIENVMQPLVSVKKISREAAFEKALGVMKPFGLEKVIHAFPDSLSGGEAQRVAIARTLVMEPEILLLDEVTSALDPENASQVVEAIKKMVREGDRTFVVVTHDLNLAREIADKILFLEEGRIVEEGHPHKIFFTPEKERTRSFVNSMMR